MPGLGVGPEAVVCSVTERERLTSAYQWQGLTSRLQAGWVSFQVVSQKEAEQLLSVSSGHSFRLKGTGEVCFFFNQNRWRCLLLCRFLRLKLVTLKYVKIKILYFFLKPSAYLPSYWALVIMLPQQNSMRQVVRMGTGGDGVCADTQSWQGGHLLCQLTSVCCATTSTEPGYFCLLLKRPPQHLALIYENSTPVLPALKSSLRTEQPRVDVGTVPLDTQEVLTVLPLPLVLPFYHTSGITHGSAFMSSPQVALLFTALPTLSPVAWVKGKRFCFSPI